MALLKDCFNPVLGWRFIASHRNLLHQMLVRTISSRYRGSVLGFAWSFAHPLMMLAVYSFVFGVVFKMRWGAGHYDDNGAAFPLIMFCGMATFNIFAETIGTCTTVVVQNQNYVKKVVFPLELLPLCSLLAALIFGLAWFVLLLLGTVIFLGHISWTMLLLPLPLIPLLLISGGVGFFVASLGVYLRDMQQLVGIVTQVLFFMTPILYPLAIVPEKMRWILQLNPLSIIVEQSRQVFLYGRLPDFGPLIGVTVLSLAVFMLGLAWFVKTKKGFADVL